MLVVGEPGPIVTSHEKRWSIQQLEELYSGEETIGPKTRGQVLRTEQWVLDMTLTPVRLPLFCETACGHRALVYRFLYEFTVGSPWCPDDA